MKRGFAIVFALLLILPGAWWALEKAYGNGDNTVLQGFPAPAKTLWLERDYYQAVEDWFDESLPLTSRLKTLRNWLNYRVFATSSNPAVHVGINGWLFSTSDSPSPPKDPDLGLRGRQMLLTLHSVENIIRAMGRQFLVTIVPTKTAIYPEFLSRPDASLRGPLYQALLAANRHHPLKSLVALEPPLIKAKLNGTMVYAKRSRLWSCAGAMAAARQILNAAGRPLPTADTAGSIPCTEPDDGLYRLLLGRESPPNDPLVGHSSGPYLVGGPVATLYGDAWLSRLLPFMSRAFGAIDVIDATQTPTAGSNLLDRDGELIMIEMAAGHLSRLHLDIEAIYSTAESHLTGVVNRPVDLRSARAVANCALAAIPDGLEIRSSGASAVFALPPVSGSTTAIFRMVKLTFSTAHHGTVAARFSPDGRNLVEKRLSRDTHFVLVPLPFDETVTLFVNPGQDPGVFILKHVELLSFYGDRESPAPETQPPTPAGGDIYSGLEIRAIAPPPTVPAAPAVAVPPAHPTQALPELTLTDIAAGRIFQRHGQSADIVVSGTYRGVSGPVEARVVAAGDRAMQMPWTVVDDSPENGVFTGILRHVPQGGWYCLEVRSQLAPWMIQRGKNHWGVGMLVACIGQSNMREWFTSGEDHTPLPLLMIHRGGTWCQPTRTGNGALAMGNRLAARLGIPIGLLDYAVNGSGLAAKAEWGAGFWRDTAPDGIYRQFIDGVQRAGGIVEMVVWMQGEADAARGTISREAYRQALQHFIRDQVRIDIGNASTQSQLPFLIIPLVKRPTGKDEPCQWIRQAQMDVLERIEACYLAATSMDLKNHGRQHLVQAAYTTLGVRTAQTILYLSGMADYYRGPSIVAFTRASPTAIDITIRHRGGDDFSPSHGITGFSVITGNQLLPVASATRTNATTIRLEMESPLPTGFHLRYLYGAHPDTSGAVHDNTELHLPLDPFDG